MEGPKGPLVAILAAMLVAAAGGCSTGRDQAFDPDAGKHPAGWLPKKHVTVCTAGSTSIGASVYAATQCTTCHGTDLAGGISGVSCSSCHLGGPFSVHPASWAPVFLTHGPSVSAGVTPVASCANQYCHGTSLQGVTDSGPSCTTCHSMPFDPATVVCGACHRIPPDGMKYPNIAGRHGKHATSNRTTCDICHSGASTYSSAHYDGVVNILFAAAYTPKTGLTPTFTGSSATCSNISCHGGQITPNWYTGSLDVNTQCSACHSPGAAQYNSYNSGHHAFHMSIGGVVCADCHDTNRLGAVHFIDLATPAMTQAAQTLSASLNYNGTSCLFTCHISNVQHDRAMLW